ncbi:MAG: hypothetical protein ACI4MJ_12115 [Aristaeellaceae bacterium]
MLDLILLPFQLVWDVICMVFKLASGLVSLVFGLLGGVLSLVISLGGLLLVGSLIVLAINRRKAYRAHQDDFASFYDSENRVE